MTNSFLSLELPTNMKYQIGVNNLWRMVNITEDTEAETIGRIVLDMIDTINNEKSFKGTAVGDKTNV